MKQDRRNAAYENIAREVERLALLVQESQQNQHAFMQDVHRLLQQQAVENEEARLKIKLNLNEEILKKLNEILQVVLALLGQKPTPVPPPAPEPTPEPVPLPAPEPTPTPTPEPEPEPEPVPLPAPEPTPEPVPVPLPDTTPAPTPVPAPVPTPVPETVPGQPAPDTMPAPTPDAPAGEVGSVPMPLVQETGTGRVRVLHASPDAPAVDVYVDGQQLLSRVAFGMISGYADLPVGRHRVQVFPTGKMAGAVIDTSVDVKRNQACTVATTGVISNIRPLVIDDELKSAPAGMSRLKVVHLSPNTPPVDVAASTGQVLVPSLGFRGKSRYVQVKPGVRALQLRPAGKQDVALQIPGIRFDADKVYTIYVVGIAGREPMVRPLLVLEE